MIPTVWPIIFLSITVALTLMLLTSIMNGEIEIKQVTLEIAFICAFVLTYGITKQISWGIVLTMVFTTASISVSVLCVIKKRLLDRRVEDLGVAVAKLHGMQTVLCRLDQIMFAKQCNIWLESVGCFQRTEKVFEAQYDGCGLNYLKRFALSWKAEQMLNRAYGLLREGHNLLHPKDQLQGTTNFYKKLVINGSGLLGIWGTGGVGKTSLLKLLVGDSRDNDSLHVLFVRAGTGCTVGQVQEAIATSLGLSLERNESSRAKTIHDHLKDTSFLLLLDDLWGYLDLKAVGIPSPLGTVRAHLQGGVVGQKQRKVVLTSRNMDLCDKMGCSRDNTIQMKCLDEVDALNLFRRGWPVANPRVDVVNKLPEALQAQTSSSSSHTARQVAIRQPQTVGDIRPQHLEDNRMSSCKKMFSFIEDEDAKSLLFGVWGMRGMGKTTLLRLVRDSYTCKACFDHILFVGAGTGGTVNNVQNAIAFNLGLDLAMMSSLDELSRAVHIFDYLEHKSFLLLLDDIREPLNWWAVGLPLFLHRQQKIIFATRSQAACALMGCHAENTIQMQCLGEDDAWNLFSDKVGHEIIDDHPQLHHLAQQMVSRCGGMPLALCSLGRAMSNKRDPREWRSAYGQLIAMRLEPIEIDEKVGTILLNPPYGWRKDTILPAADQIHAKTSIVHGQKQATVLPLDAAKIFDQSNQPKEVAATPPARVSASVRSRTIASRTYQQALRS